MQQIAEPPGVYLEQLGIQRVLCYELRFGFAERPFRQNGPTWAGFQAQHGAVPLWLPNKMFSVAANGMTVQDVKHPQTFNGFVSKT